MINNKIQYSVVVPAAGVGKRMASDCPKQYLRLNKKIMLEHTVERLLSHPYIHQVILPISEEDEYFQYTSLVKQANLIPVFGGVERVDSVLAGLKILASDDNSWVLVHDAARPCIHHHDITNLIEYCQVKDHGAILANPVRDTMKLISKEQIIEKTVDRSQLYHALTPQMFKTAELIEAITWAKSKQITITDEASAMEACGYLCGVVEGRGDNIKVTRPEDLPLAEFILSVQDVTN